MKRSNSTSSASSSKRSASRGSDMSEQKIDFKKTLDSYQAKRGVYRIVDVPPTQYLMVDGHGDPNTAQQYTDALSALYPVAYKLKFASKQQLGRDYVVMPLEALWWSDDMASFTSSRDKSKWDWTAMIMVPNWITPEMFDAAVAKVAAGARPASLDKVRLEILDEGRCVQTLHVGAFDDEAPVLEKMHHEFIPGEGLTMTGKHHEIYLSDFRKVEPAKLRTILRQPVA
ncbi:GyrI-like domain-containing protein [Cystobacter fuscus]